MGCKTCGSKRIQESHILFWNRMKIAMHLAETGAEPAEPALTPEAIETIRRIAREAGLV